MMVTIRNFFLGSTVTILLACGVVSEVRPNSNRDEIIDFTRKALVIEAERNSLMAYMARVGTVRMYFFRGITAERANNSKTVSSEGMRLLQKRLLLLDAPQSLHSVKESLVHAYTTEIELGVGHSARETGEPLMSSSYVDPRVTKDNILDFKDRAEQFEKFSNRYQSYIWAFENQWGQTQLFRKEIYDRWSEILEKQGLDPAEEGLTDLVLDR